MNFVQGTDLRDKNGTYRWETSGRVREYVSITKIRDFFFAEGLSHVYAWAVAKKAKELGEAVRKEEAVHIPVERFNEKEDCFEWVPEPYNPLELLCDTVRPGKRHWLSQEGGRFMGLAGERGTLVDSIFPKWGAGLRLEPNDVPYWVDDQIAENNYRCDLDEATGYCLSAFRWLTEHEPIIIAHSLPVFDDRLGAAGTWDLLWNLGGSVDLVEVKTADQTSWGHVVQASFYRHAPWLGRPGITRRTKNFKPDRTIILHVTLDGVKPRVIQNTMQGYEAAKMLCKAYHLVHAKYDVQTLKELVTK